MRTPRVDKNGIKKGAWSAEEDQKLIDYIKRYRIWNWTLMPEFAGLSRNGKSCRLRWVNYLDPKIRRGNITKEEEKIIIDMYAKIGSRWSKIAAKLPGRSDNEIKNYWHTHLKKLFKEELPKKRKKFLENAIPKLEANVENSYESHNLILSATTSEGSNSQDSINLAMTSQDDACFFSVSSLPRGSVLDFQEVDQVSIDSSETIGNYPLLGGNGNKEYELKQVDVEEWYQEPLSPYGIFSNEYWLNEFQFMDGTEQPDVYYNDEFESATIS